MARLAGANPAAVVVVVLLVVVVVGSPAAWRNDDGFSTFGPGRLG